MSICRLGRKKFAICDEDKDENNARNWKWLGLKPNVVIRNVDDEFNQWSSIEVGQTLNSNYQLISFASVVYQSTLYEYASSWTFRSNWWHATRQLATRHQINFHATKSCPSWFDPHHPLSRSGTYLKIRQHSRNSESERGTGTESERESDTHTHQW